MSSVPTANSKTSTGTHLVTWHGDQYVGPTPLRRTWPLNEAPTSGPVEPRVHRASKVSGENSPMRVTSETSAHTFSGGTSIHTDTSPDIPRLTARTPAAWLRDRSAPRSLLLRSAGSGRRGSAAPP